MAHKLTADHITPSYGKKMKVSLAAQVLSRRAAIAIRTYSNELSPNAPRTADLLEFFNSVFDFCNSSSVLDFGTRRPALRTMWDEQKEVGLIELQADKCDVHVHYMSKMNVIIKIIYNKEVYFCSFVALNPVLFQNILQWEDRISKIKFRNVRTKKLKSTLPFKEGWLVTLRALSMMLSELLQIQDISFVLTRRLNQDPVEVIMFFFT